jgi:cell division protein FtsZ
MMPPAAQHDPSLAAFDTDASHYGLEPAAEEMEDDAAEAFIAPVAEAPVRIPRVEDFPPVVQRQIEARQQPQQRPAHEDRGPMSLLRRLASVGLGRAQEEPAAEDRQPAPVQRPAQKAAPAQQRQMPPQPRAAQRPRQPAKDAMYRPAEGNLDPHGRPQPAARAVEDELEIPAFLRRQAN